MPALTSKVGLTPENIIKLGKTIRALGNPEDRKREICTSLGTPTLELLEELKRMADLYLRKDIEKSLTVGKLIVQIGQDFDRPTWQALGHLANGNVLNIGFGKHPEAIECYDHAANLYVAEGEEVNAAKSQIGKLWSLASSGRYPEAWRTYEAARSVLTAANETLLVAKLDKNMGAISDRQGEYHQALEIYERAEKAFKQVEHDPGSLAGIAYNRALTLRNLGNLEQAVDASEKALDLLSQTDQVIRIARARQSLALTYHLMGKYNQAMFELQTAAQIFRDDGRYRDAFLAELFRCEILLSLQRFDEVLEKCSQIQTEFNALNLNLEIGQSLLLSAAAAKNSSKEQDARRMIVEALNIFKNEENAVWKAVAEQELAAISLSSNDFEAAELLAENASNAFQQAEIPHRQMAALLLLVQAELSQNKIDDGATTLAAIEQLLDTSEVPSIRFTWHSLTAELHEILANKNQALDHLTRAISIFEKLRANIMVEYRSGFTEGKESVYQRAFNLSLDLNAVEDALLFAEQSKSRSLRDLLEHNLLKPLYPEGPEDDELIHRLNSLKEKRQTAYLQFDALKYSETEGDEYSLKDRGVSQNRILEIENEMSLLWHELLVKNHAYAKQAPISSLTNYDPTKYIEEGVMCLEYFFSSGKWHAFLIGGEEIKHVALTADPKDIKKGLEHLDLHLAMIPYSRPDQTSRFRVECDQILSKLHDLLAAPLLNHLQGVDRLLIIPHSCLHYLPFHALYDGDQYICQKFQITYLPAVNLLPFFHTANRPLSRSVCAGYSFEGRLPHARLEATEVGRILDAEVFIEEDASIENVLLAAKDIDILHLAVHGAFRHDNPLFSGLRLADGWLTTLDIIRADIDVQLVTLSGCSTGRSLIAGGDELLGLSRACLSAGASSLLLSQWAVHDASTQLFMRRFYKSLIEGAPPSRALQATYLSFLHRDATVQEGGDFSHPYFWAPFFLIGI